ncbi:MAG: F0F1 ATP synthase subunit alpha [Lachnospiraceae bacterium]|nr:F0F1 ATP synthase subunit alpha [Lachnospiraceae bacterium]
MSRDIDLDDEKKDLVEAELLFVTPPGKEQLKGFEEFIKSKYNAERVEIETREDKSLGGGFILRVENEEYDWSNRGRIRQLKHELESHVHNENAENTQENIISILREQIDGFELSAESREIGDVIRVGDGIAYIDGINHAAYGEVVLFDNGVKGMVMNIERDRTGVMLFGDEDDVYEGMQAARTMSQAGIGVSEDMLGRVINALGDPIDGLGKIDTSAYKPIERPAPPIIDRQPVNTPMETGILAIDSMFPIGRGQRELIIGDRQTGKTSIAVDTIINQRDKGVICIYVAIGQKASTVARVVQTLKNNDALDHTIIVNATASEPASLQYIAPYAGTAVAEYFMEQGRDVLIVYDDLSKHAVAYREISLLLNRPPGREAFPGDVFYLHSRLLERSSRLSPELGGGSITALPVIETQEGDVSSYIPTNVISITDGQIFLEGDLFFEGQRPAVNVGLSVSRVGGAAQSKAMKAAAGSLRIDLAQYREMEVFTQFSSDLDQVTKDQLENGRALMEILKQPIGMPLSGPEQVITLVAANAKLFMGIPANGVKRFQWDMLKDMKENHAGVISELQIQQELSQPLKETIIGIVGKYKEEWLEQRRSKTE